MPKSLFVYTSESSTGLTAKAIKIEEGFREAGYEPTSVYFAGGTGAVRRIVDGFLVVCKATWFGLRGGYDVILIRYAYYFLPLYLVLGRLLGNVRIEVNGDSEQEMQARRQPVRAMLNSLALRAALTGRGRVHVVSKSLTRQYQSRYPFARVVFTPNFVCDAYYEPRTAHISEGQPVNLVFLGNAAQRWHGVLDFIETVAVGDWFRTGCRLHIIGTRTQELDELVDRLGLQECVVIHGFLSGDRKHALMNQMHIGIGGFALYRKGLTETTAIKTGEYLHAGLAVIIGYDDSALRDDLPFVLRVDFADKQESVEAIRAFIGLVRSDPRLSREAHIYASENLLVNRYIQRIVES